MKTLPVVVGRLAGDRTAQDLIEYSLLVGLIALVAVFAVGSLGHTVNAVLWEFIDAALG